MEELLDRLQSVLGVSYTFERELGGGAMARVFLAEESALERRVVVKVLPPELAVGVDAARFRREIQVAASLTHPHIVPLLSAGEADGLPYYTMPFLEGESLRNRLTREGRLPIVDAVHMAQEVAEALDYAHRSGIVHRDIKPENILLHDGHALVADFGIARAVTRATTTLTLTQVGLALGTPLYMSPEQALGEGNVDGRTDVYSLGCVLYEMVAGGPPYEGATPQAIIVKHCTAAVPSIPDLPSWLREVIETALAKEPAGRFQTAGELGLALARTEENSIRLARTFGAAPPRERSVAVLPFENLSPDPDSDYFSDGMTEDVIARLTKVSALRVIARTSVMRYRRSTLPVREIARELGVATIVKGSVRRAGDRLRIVTQLLDAATDEHLWAETFDRNLIDVFAIQSEIAGEIAKALEATLTPAERMRLERRPTNDLDAYSLYLLGRYHYHRVTGPDLKRGIEYLEGAVRRDRLFAEAHALLAQANCYLGQGYWGHRPADYLPRARRAATQALAADPGLAEARAACGMISFWQDFDWDAAEREFRQAIALDPNNTLSLLQYAVALAARLDFSQAIPIIERACSLDPVSVNLCHNFAFLLRFARRYDRARAQIERGLSLDPAHAGAYWVLGLLELDLGRFAEAITALETGVRLAGGSSLHEMTLASAYATAGRSADARRVLAELETREAAGEYLWPVGMAMAFAQLGELDRGIALIAQAVDERAGWVWIGMEPRLDPLRGDPRFDVLLERVGLKQCTPHDARSQ